ncbi:MAG: hypothetical protein R6T87_02580, partial [Marinobacter sp.]
LFGAATAAGAFIMIPLPPVPITLQTLILNTSGAERYSVPFFYSGNPDQEVSCLSLCLADGDQPHYPPTTVEAHLMEMYQRTYA